jgi:hypothetical protein
MSVPRRKQTIRAPLIEPQTRPAQHAAANALGAVSAPVRKPDGIRRGPPGCLLTIDSTRLLSNSLPGRNPSHARVTYMVFGEIYRPADSKKYIWGVRITSRLKNMEATFWRTPLIGYAGRGPATLPAPLWTDITAVPFRLLCHFALGTRKSASVCEDCLPLLSVCGR